MNVNRFRTLLGRPDLVGGATAAPDACCTAVAAKAEQIQSRYGCNSRYDQKTASPEKLHSQAAGDGCNSRNSRNSKGSDANTLSNAPLFGTTQIDIENDSKLSLCDGAKTSNDKVLAKGAVAPVAPVTKLINKDFPCNRLDNSECSAVAPLAGSPDPDPEREAIQTIDGAGLCPAPSPLRAREALADQLAGLPADWRAALEAIEARADSVNPDRAKRPPVSIPLPRWRQIQADARYLIIEWGHSLFVTGWTLPDLFLSHKTHSLTRSDGNGLCMVIDGRKVGPILADKIGIHSPEGATLYFRRFNPPPGETLMLWELP